MNILLLVSAFLIALALGCSALFQSHVTIMVAEKSFTGRLAAQRLALNAVQKKQYSRALKREKKEKNAQTSDEQKRSVSSPRTKQNPLPDSKLNLAPLLSPFSSTNQGKLYEIAAALVEELYKGSAVETFAKEKKVDSFALRILDSMIAKAKREPEATSLKELFPDDAVLSALYYKMLKGTQNYDGKLGYPALEDYLSFDKESKRKPISFSFATAPLLKVLFGEKVMLMILREEKEKSEKANRFVPMHEKEFNQLLLQFPEGKLDPTGLNDLIHFNRKKEPAKEYMLIDPKTQIVWKTTE